MHLHSQTKTQYLYRQGFTKVKKIGKKTKGTSRKIIECWVISNFLPVEECWKKFCKTHKLSDPSCFKLWWVLLFTCHSKHLHRKAAGFAKTKKHCTPLLSVKVFQLSSYVVVVSVVVVVDAFLNWLLLCLVNLEHLFPRVGWGKGTKVTFVFFCFFWFGWYSTFAITMTGVVFLPEIRVLQIWFHLLVRRELEKTLFACT